MEKFKISKTDALVGIDFQRDFINGLLGSPASEKASERFAAIIPLFTEAGAPVYLTKDVHEPCDYSMCIEGKRIRPHCLKDGEGSGISSLIIHTCFDYGNLHIRTKNTFSDLFWNEEQELEKKSRIFIGGLVTDICVVSNALLLRSTFPEVKMYCIADCCAGLTPEKHKAALDVMDSCLVDIITFDMLTKGDE